MFEDRTGDRELLALHFRQARTAGADRVIKSDLDQGAAQTELIKHLGNRGVYTLATARLAAHDSTEQNILLDRRRCIVALGVEEFDRTPQLLGQSRGEGAPRLQYPLLYFFVDQIQRVAGRDQFERQ